MTPTVQPERPTADQRAPLEVAREALVERMSVAMRVEAQERVGDLGLSDVFYRGIARAALEALGEVPQ